MTKKWMLVVWLCAVTGIAALSDTTKETRVGMELLPRGRLFRLTFADPREIRMALSFEGDSRIDAAIGNYFSLFALRDPNELWKFYMGLEGAGYFTMRHADSRFPLETADGLIGTYFEGATENWQAQLRFTHVSAHLADGSAAAAIPYSREYLTLRFGWVPNAALQLYGGLQYLTNTVPVVPRWALQAGGSYFIPWSHSLTPFIGTDFKWREESPVNPSFSLNLGVALANPPEAYRSFRFFYSYFTGTDARGQFYDKLLTYHSLGIEMQI